jgi:SP family general alpha glucoside:H+ symporter-like MFS transporter
MQLRAASQSIGLFTQFVSSWVFSFTVPYMFDVDAGNLGGKVGFIFSFLCACGFILIWVEIPETKNRTYAELDEMFEKKLPTRQFKNYVCSGFQSVFPSKAKEAGV